MKHYRALIAVTSHLELGSTGRTTGFQLAELTHPLFELERVHIHVDILSPQGGLVKMDENSRDLSDPINRDYMERTTFRHKIANTLTPKNVSSTDYSAIILAGGYGALWDFPNNNDLAILIGEIYQTGGVVGALSQGVSGLMNVILQNGEFLIDQKKITGMTDQEVKMTGLGERLPFSLEAGLKEKGATFLGQKNWHKHLVVDGRLVTGQNTATSQAVGEAVRQIVMKNKPLN